MKARRITVHTEGKCMQKENDKQNGTNGMAFEMSQVGQVGKDHYTSQSMNKSKVLPLEHNGST